MQQRFKHRIEIHVRNCASSANPCKSHCVAVDLGYVLYDCNELGIAFGEFICKSKRKNDLPILRAHWHLLHTRYPH